MRTILKNGTLLTPIRKIDKTDIIIENDKIQKILENGEKANTREQDQVIDVDGKYIAPGFIDLHTHGGGGFDFMDGTVEAFKKAGQAHLQHGTTALVPTTLTSSEQETYKILESFNKAQKEIVKGPEIPGLHLEGPYFSHEQKGAQDPEYIRNPAEKEYKKLLDICPGIIRWTLAPELDGAFKMAGDLAQKDILASIGHSNAVYDQVLKAFENGFNHVTHLYSGMSSVRRIDAFRYSGVVESAYLIDEMTVEIIADGCHLPASLLKLIYKIKGPDKIALVTDSMRAAGMPAGKYILGSKQEGREVIVEDGVAKLKDRSAFAGSVATADRLVKTMWKKADISIQNAVKMMTLTPAKILGIDDKKGMIAAGKDADIVVFDENIDIKLVVSSGDIMVNDLN